jgi:chromosome segregation ATPase
MSSILESAIRDINTELEELKEENAALRAKSKRRKQLLGETDYELREVKDELKSTKADLEGVSCELSERESELENVKTQLDEAESELEELRRFVTTLNCKVKCKGCEKEYDVAVAVDWLGFKKTNCNECYHNLPKRQRLK